MSVGAVSEGGAGRDLVPFAVVHEATFRAEPRETPPKRDWGRIAAGVSLAAVVLVGAAAAAAHVMALRQGERMARRLDTVSARLEAVEANRTRDELANLKKVLAEIKAGAASAKEAAGAVGQVAARVDKLEKGLDKLGDRIDHDAASRIAEVTGRLDRLEGKAVAAVPSPPLKAAGKTEVAKTEPAVSNETTAAVEKPKPRLRGFYLAAIRNGYAMIDSPDGEFSVGPGDVVPGGGRVLRIERHGRDWVVVTTQGTIASE